MIRAVPAQAIGSFQERRSPPSLRDSFACTWIHRMPAAGAPPIIVAPDGTIDLQWIDGTFRVAGPDKDPQTEILSPGAIVVGFRFRPATAAAWLGVPAHELVGQRLALEDLWGAKAHHLASSIPRYETVAELINALETSVAQCTAAHAADLPMRAVFDLIEQGVPLDVPLIPRLMQALGMSERTLRRRFDESFGYGPKTLDRILRYQRFRRLGRRSRESTALLAAEAGYSDQAHLVRESRRLTGNTPRALERIINDMMVGRFVQDNRPWRSEAAQT